MAERRFGWTTRHRVVVILPLDALLDARLSPRDLCMLAALSSWRDGETGLVRASRKNIAARALGVTERSVSRAVARLERTGWVLRIGKQGGRRSPNLYQIDTPPELINGDASVNVSQEETLTVRATNPDASVPPTCSPTRRSAGNKPKAGEER